jgi:hypothetical protein
MTRRWIIRATRPVGTARRPQVSCPSIDAGGGIFKNSGPFSLKENVVQTQKARWFPGAPFSIL